MTQPETSSANFYPEALKAPVPNMDEARQNKVGYQSVPIDLANKLFDEPLIKLSELGIAGQSYYSHPNAATGDAVEGVEPDQHLRASVAQTLAMLNDLLRHPSIGEFFGGAVELYVEEALRPISLQEHLYDTVFPELIRKQNPSMSEDEVAERRDQLSAQPSHDPTRPSPHATGGAFDIKLRYTEDGEQYKAGDDIEMGHQDADTSARVNPDYYETHVPNSERELMGQANRRAFYAIMTGAAFGTETGFVNNPTEWWHWGRGDQLSARVAGEAMAAYSFAEPK